MPTKVELLDFAAAHEIAASDSMLKADIEAAIQAAGYDPLTLQPLTQEDSSMSETEVTPSAAQTPPIPQFLPGNAAGDPTVTTLEQEAAVVTPESIKAASFARMPMPSWAYPTPSP